jgi:uncharacterized protein YecE (DUF72 family)
MILRVGQSPSSLAIARYTKHFDLLEVRLDNGAPRRRTLETMKSEASPQLAFAVLVPKQIATLESEPGEQDLTGTLATAQGLGARFIVLRTPPSARPGPRTRARITRVVQLLKAADISIVWEPSGLLAEADSEALSEELGVTLARDPARDDLPAAELAYGRISSLGSGGRVRSSAIERAAERLSVFPEAYVIIEGDNAIRAAKDLRDMLGVEFGSDPADEDGPEEGEDEGEDEDFEDEDEDDEA